MVWKEDIVVVEGEGEEDADEVMVEVEVEGEETTELNCLVDEV